MPASPDAPRAINFRNALREWITRPRPFETRPVILDGPGDRPPRPPFDNVWFRAAGPVPDDVRQRQILLAYLSDMTLLQHLAAAARQKLFSPPCRWPASITRCGFIATPPLDDWLLYAQDSPSASGARGFNRGLIFTREGVLIASVAQEGLIRPRT